MELKQIEATVVILLTNDMTGKMQTIPFWECEMSKKELYEVAANACLQFNESCGGGTVTAEIFDYRK